ncbi:MAG: hypothetical protein OXF02_00360 [Simkaniaceae bacterium]|nr:hypothetical protein [Simkaniaceae bacterium]
MASAIGEGRSVVQPESEEYGTAMWLDNRLGGPPLRFGPLPQGRKHRVYTEEERNAVVNYAVEQRLVKSIEKCAVECGLSRPGLSRLIRDECKAYSEVATAKPDIYIGKIADCRELLVRLRQWSGKGSIRLSDYLKASVGKWDFNRNRPPAREQSRDGHPYFPPAGKGSKRTFTNDQKKRTVSHWLSGLGGNSIEKYARACGLFPSTLYEWISEVEECDSGESDGPDLPGDRPSPNSECEPLRDTSLNDAEQLWPMNAEEGTAARLDGDVGGVYPPPKRQKRKKHIKKEMGTAKWLDNSLGGPPLRFDPLPKGKRRSYTGRERGAIVDYVVEQREVQSIGKCANDIGINASCISYWLKEECETYRAFSESDIDGETLRALDCRKLLADLRAGKTSLRIRDYTGGEKYSKGTRGQKLKEVRAKEETRDGHPYFASPGKGKRRVFTNDQKEGVVDYWLSGFEGEAISDCAKEINLHVQTLSDWVDTYGRGRKRRPLHTMKSPESSSEGTVSDSDEDLLPGVPWQHPERWYPEHPRSHACMGGSISGCSRECNLGEPPPIDWVDDTYGRRASKRFCPNTTEPSENLPGGTASDSYEDRLPGVSWRDPEGRYPEYLSNDDTYGCASKRFCPNTTEPSENLPGGTASDSYEDRLPGVSWRGPEGWYPEYLSNLEF